MPLYRTARQSISAARMPISAAAASNIIASPIRMPSPDGASPYPLADTPPGGSASVSWGEPAKEPTPWLLYAGIGAAVAVVGYVVYMKKIRKGRR